MIRQSCDIFSLKTCGKMFRSIFFSALFLLSVAAEGEIRILVTPESLQLIGHDPIDNNAFRELFPALLGLTIEKPSNWSGLEVSSPFHYSKAAVVLVADGITSLETSIDPLVSSNIHVFTLTSTENEKVVYDELRRRIEERYPPNSIGDAAAMPLKSTVRRIRLDERVKNEKVNEPLEAESLKFLDPSLAEDQRFLQELVSLKKFVNEIKTGSNVREGIPNVYWVVMKSLKSVSEFHGQDSDATQEAKRLVRSMAEQLSSATTAAYGKKVVVATVALPDVPVSSSHGRYPRAAPSEKPAPIDGLAEEYSEDYPVIFNIILWFTVVFAFSLLAVSLSIAFMDPGRDSIIYRMTSTRMKKDN